MPTDDLISVMIPAYNHERYIEECVRSIIAQTYQNIELLVIDDGSKDKTFETLQSLKSECEKRFVRVVMETQENQGTRLTLNKLVDIANGKFICAPASDDRLKSVSIEKLHKFLIEKEYSEFINILRLLYHIKFFSTINSSTFTQSQKTYCN